MKILCDEIMQTTRPATRSNNIPNLTFHFIDFRNKNVVFGGNAIVITSRRLDYHRDMNAATPSLDTLARSKEFYWFRYRG